MSRTRRLMLLVASLAGLGAAPSRATASAPFHREITLPALEVRWSANVQPLAVGWAGGEAHRPRAAPGKLLLPRHKFPAARMKLIVVPRDRRLAPLVLQVPDAQRRVVLRPRHFRRIRSDELWLWGQTPHSRCSRGFASLTAQSLHRKQLKWKAGGLFAWQINRGALSSTPVLSLLSYPHDRPRAITARALEKASAADRTRCARYYGAPCPFVFRLLAHGFGARHEVGFVGAPPGDQYNCPRR